MTIGRWIIGGAIVAGLVAGGAYASKVYAADLKGDCGCADLEERVQELEASTVRAKTRKVKLTISGVVHKGVLYHNNDDLPGKGKASFYDGSTDPSRIRIQGEAKASPTWGAGFVIEIAYAGNAGSSVDTGPALLSLGAPADGKNEFQIGEHGTTIRHSYVYMKGVAGEVRIGQQSIATDGIIEVNTSQSNVATRALQTMPLNYGGAISGLYLPFDGYRAVAAYYETPTFAGFTGSVSYQQDETWDGALRFAQEAGGFKIAAGIGYRDQKAQTLANLINVLDLITANVSGSHKAVSGSFSVMHTATGLYVNGYASQLKYSDMSLDIGILPPLFAVSVPLGITETVKAYGVQVGIERNWTGGGATTLFGLWEKTDGQLLVSDMKTYGLGAVQAIDQLGVQLYATAKRYEVDASPACIGLCKNTDLFMAGAKIAF